MSGTGSVDPAARAKLRDVATRAGVSTATVSLVLRGAPGPSAQTRAEVLASAAALDYRPNRSARLLARRRTRLLGVLIDVRNAFHAELIEDLQDAADARGYDLVLSTLRRGRLETRGLETLIDFRCEALILLGPRSSPAELDSLARQLPVVVIGRCAGIAGVDVVRTADDVGIAQAVDHLVSLGHRRITFVDGGRGPIASERRRGYRSAMRSHCLGEHIRVLPGDGTESSGVAAAHALVEQAEPRGALVAFNDRCALGLIDGLIRAGRDVPTDFSVVGYDDSPPARLAHVNLTTVRQDAPQQALHAVELAVQRLEQGRVQVREVVFPPHLVVRGTTAIYSPTE